MIFIVKLIVIISVIVVLSLLIFNVYHYFFGNEFTKKIKEGFEFGKKLSTEAKVNLCEENEFAAFMNEYYLNVVVIFLVYSLITYIVFVTAGPIYATLYAVGSLYMLWAVFQDERKVKNLRSNKNVVKAHWELVDNAQTL
jgi:hypothetical protein